MGRQSSPLRGRSDALVSGLSDRLVGKGGNRTFAAVWMGDRSADIATFELTSPNGGFTKGH